MSVFGAVLSAAPASFAQSQPVDSRYAVFELPTLGGPYSLGWGIDESGNVIGAAFLPGNIFHASVWVDGQRPIDLGTLGGETSECRGINANGWIVGRSEIKNDPHRAAFLWHDGEMINLGNLGGLFAEAYGINDHNQIVGWSDMDNVPGSPSHAFLWEDGKMIDLGTLNGNASEAIAINNSGLIVGQAWSDITTTWRPVIWTNGEIIDLGTFRPDNHGTGICIDCNEAGDVVGYAVEDNGGHYRGFVYHNGLMRKLPEKRHWTNSNAWSINDNRQIVGGCLIESRPEDEGIGCIWEWQQPPQYLGELIPPRSNWWIGLAIHNNDAGQITGTGYRLTDPGHTKGYLLTPVHPTMELSQAVPGIAGQENTLSLIGATPGAPVRFVYSRRGGGAAIPGCTLQTNCLQIDHPRLIGTAIADANGHASITATVPLVARGQTILFQAFVKDECAVSQLTGQRME